MTQPLSEYLGNLARAFVHSAREATKEAVQLANNSGVLDAEVNIGGVPLPVEGAANLPRTILMMSETEIETEAFLSVDEKGIPSVTLKRGLFKSASPMTVKMKFDRSPPLESIELVRDRANECVRMEVQKHRLKIGAGGKDANVEALEGLLKQIKQEEKEDESVD